MPRTNKAVLRFVRALLGGEAVREANEFVVGDTRVALSAADVRQLVAHGAIDGNDRCCRANAGTASWLKRQMLEADAFAAQHRVETPTRDGAILNLAESPLARLAAAGPDGEAFLRPHQVEAGERLRRLVERAQLHPRVTMSYSAAHTASSGPGQAVELGDLSADARRKLAELYRQLPRDCADVLLDVCGFGKGLQQVETDRNWPRRSAKLVLRIGLDRLAELYGLTETATGAEVSRRRAWMDGARVAMFG